MFLINKKINYSEKDLYIHKCITTLKNSYIFDILKIGFDL